jgi:hypothetical protein
VVAPPSPAKVHGHDDAAPLWPTAQPPDLRGCGSHRRLRLRTHARSGPLLPRRLHLSSRVAPRRRRCRLWGAPPRDSPIGLGEWCWCGGSAGLSVVSRVSAFRGRAYVCDLEYGGLVGRYWTSGAAAQLTSLLTYAASNRFLGSSVWSQIRTAPEAEH